VKLGGVVGALLAVTILFVFTEWLYVETFANHEVFDAVSFVLVAALGALAGSALGRRFVRRRAETHLAQFSPPASSSRP
jgi:nitrate reductase gamma subunit